MPDSKINKRIKNAELALKRAEGRGADEQTIYEHRALLQELYAQKGINKAGHDHG